MTAWTPAELDRVGAAEELQIAVPRADGTLRRPVVVWVVRVGDALYVRAYRGRASAWFRGAQARRQGHIRAGGLDRSVLLEEETDPETNDRIDAAYLAKYRRYPEYVAPMVSPVVRAATFRLMPVP